VEEEVEEVEAEEEPQPEQGQALLARGPVQWRQAPLTGLAPVRLRAPQEVQTRRCYRPVASYCIHRLLKRLAS
jgi:hypothetical protein